MVQIIDNSPSAETLRMRALNDPMNVIAQGMDQIGNAYLNRKETLRQQALSDQGVKLKLAEMGLADPQAALNELRMGRQETAPAQDAMPTQYGQELQGPTMPGQGGLRQIISQAREAVPAQYAPSAFTQYTPQKQAEIDLKTQDARQQRELRQAQLEELRIKKNLSPLSERKMQEEIKNIQARTFGEYETARLKTLGQEKEKTGVSRLSKMSAEGQNKIGAIASGLKALDDMGASLKQGYGPEYVNANTPLIGNFISDTPFTQAQRVVSEVVGRLQSGGAIGTQELKNFNDMGPRAGDSPKIAAKKLEDQKSFLNNKLAAFGIKKDELQNAGFDIGTSQQNAINVSNNNTSVINHPQVSEAMQWAQANPNDPRAKVIMQGLQSGQKTGAR